MNDLAGDTTASGSRVAPFNFHGQTGDYFRIWIVNVALTVLTLGIYSAWAKVRKLRYFYGNTELEGATFDYHASPLGILLGRVIAVAVLGLYWLLATYLPAAGFVLIAVVVLLIPVLVVRAHMFQLRNSSYRQIRFGFEPAYGGAFSAYYGGALVTVLTLGLGSPYALYLKHRFRIDNARFGQTPFRFGGESGAFFKIVYAGIGLAILALIAFLIVTVPFADILAESEAAEPQGAGAMIRELLITLPIFLIYGAIGVYTAVRIRNYLWTNTSLRQNGFASALSVRTMCWLYLTNILAIVFTIGLAVPWAQIRLARYRAECTQAVLAGDWREFMAGERQQASALGEELGEAFDVGVDLSI